MKRLGLVFVLILSVFLFKTADVYAESGHIVGYDEIFAKDIYTPPTARFYDFVNGITALTTEYNSTSGYYPSASTPLETDATGQGGAVAFDVNETFVPGYVYNIMVYLCASPSSVYPKVNSIHASLSTASSLTNAMNNFGSNTRARIIYRSNQFGTSRLISNGNIYCGRLIFVFEPVSTGTTIFVPFQSSAYSYQWTLLGYTLTNYGAVSSLTSSDIQDIIDDSNYEILSVISSAETSINNNINSTRSSINNTITNSTNQIDNTIKDDTIDTTQSNSFFDNFSDIDNGGISAVITSPLQFINSMTSTCQPLSFTIFNQNISLPCGNTLFWDKPEVSAFRDIWNILVGGGAVYMILRKVFITIENIKDPENDKVDVMSL